MKRRMQALALSLVLVLALALTGCSGSSGGGAETAAAAPSVSENRFESSGTGNGFAAMDTVATPAPMETPDAGESDIPAGGIGPEADQSAKIIYTGNVDLETTAFEEATAGLEKLVSEMGGYIQSSDARTGGSGYRYANYTVRVPQEKFQEFLDKTGEVCHQVWRSVSQEDVSEVYYDTSGRLKTQQLKLERLQELLAKADNMTDIITIESAIADTEYQIDSLSGELRHYDALVDYSTVNVSLQEVYKLSNVEEAPVTFADRLSSSFSDGLSAFGEWLEDFAIAAAYSWMWWLLAIVVVVVVFCLVRRKVRKVRLGRKQKNRESQEAQETKETRETQETK